MYHYKKLSATLMMAGLLAGLGSCSSEDVATPLDETAEEGTVTFVCQAPAMPNASGTTRAYSDGQKADNLYYAVYVVDETTDLGYRLTETNLPNTSVSANKPYTFNNETKPKTTVNLHVAVGQTYTVAFFGCPDDAPYALDPENAKLTVEYAGAKCNDELRDAFYATTTFTASKANPTINVTLHRPLAQVNVGTAWTDWATATHQNFAPTQSGFKVTGVPTTMDLITGKTSGSTDVDFALADLPDGEVFPKLNTDGSSDYKYLSMVYVLMGEKEGDGQTFTVEFYTENMQGSDALNIENVPMERNHRTNIYGNGLLTFEATIDVLIDPNYDLDDWNFGPYEQFLAWAGAGSGNLQMMGDLTSLQEPYTINVATGEERTLQLNGHTISFVNSTSLYDHFIRKTGEGLLIIEGPGTIRVSEATALDIQQGKVMLVNVTVEVAKDTKTSYNCLAVKSATTGATTYIYGDSGTYSSAKSGAQLVSGSVVVYSGSFVGWNPSGFVSGKSSWTELNGIYRVRLEQEIATYRTLLEDQDAHYNNLPTTNAI